VRMGYRGIGRVLGWVALAAVLTLGWAASPVLAGTIIVDQSGTGDYTTIQAAVTAADPNDVITVSAGTYTENVIIDKSLTMQGAGFDQTFVEGVSADAGVFQIGTADRTITVLITGLTIQDGSGWQGGGVYNEASLTLKRCKVSGNYLSDGGLGGGIANGQPGLDARMTVDECTIDGNSATRGGGIWNAGALTITKSTIKNNRAYTVTSSGDGGNGGGILSGEVAGDVELTVTDSTVSGNAADSRGGGIAFITESGYANESTLLHVTVTGNQVTGSDGAEGGGGAISVFGGTHVIRNSILYGNTDVVGYPDIHLISGDVVTSSVIASGDPDPLLDPLQLNGGETETHALRPGSPAIDAGNDAYATATDQRGVARPAGQHCDIGAYEYEPPSTLYVDDSWTGPGDAGGHIWHTDAFSSVQEAVAAAAAGSTIEVAAGAYTESITVTTPGLTIILADKALIRGSSPCFTVEEDDVTITSATPGMGVCQPDGGDHGIHVAGSATNTLVNNLVIRAIEIDGSTTATADGIHIDTAVANLRILDNLIHDMAGSGLHVEDVSVGHHEIQGNLFQNTGHYGVQNKGSALDVTFNSWGAIDGPSGDGPSDTGDAITGTLTYEPWTYAALGLAPSGTANGDVVEGYQEITYTVRLDAHQVQGAQFDLHFVTETLQVTSLIDTGVFTGFGVLSTSEEANDTGTISFWGDRGDAGAISGTQIAVYTVTFLAAAEPVAPVPIAFDQESARFSTTDSNYSNNVYATAMTGTSLEILSRTSVTGTIRLQGRPDDSGANVTFLPGETYGRQYDFVTSGYWGQVTAHDVVYVDTYTVVVHADHYLDVTELSGVTATISGADVLLAPVMLWGGDVTEGLSGETDVIDINDASFIAGQYGSDNPDCDINQDTIVDIFDLAILGGNYGKSSATAYADWHPTD